jgi:hypothetical protein
MLAETYQRVGLRMADFADSPSKKRRQVEVNTLFITPSLRTHLDELRRTEVAVVYRTANQQIGYGQSTASVLPVLISVTVKHEAQKSGIALGSAERP